MRTDLLVRRTRKHFPRLDVSQIKIAAIQKGGSDRKFYRIRCSAEQALILVKYNREREENRHYVTIANFLTEHRIRVPEIYFHDANEGLIWLEDLGERDLYSYCDESWLVRRAFYESVFERARERGANEVTAEVNLEPENPGSIAFHERLGFRQLAEQDTKGGTIRVALLARPVY